MSLENKETGNNLECYIRLKYQMFPKEQKHESGDWCVVTASVEDVISGEPKIHPKYKTIKIIGNLPRFNYNESYKLVAKEIYSEDYGYSYEVFYFGQPMKVNNENDKRIFLENILTDTQLKNFYDTYENPFDIIANENIADMTKVKGIGAKTALNIIELYKNHIDYSSIYVKLNDFGLSKKMIEKLIDKYKSPDIIVDKIKNNPYILIDEVTGIGWDKADKMALESGMSKISKFRIKAFIKYVLNTEALNGNSYVDPVLLTRLIKENIEGLDNKILAQIIQELYSEKVLWHNYDKRLKRATKVALYKYYWLEYNISQELKRIANGKNDFKYDNWKEVIKKVEKQQGWEYTDEQKNGIKQALDSQFIMITGGGGTGKTSVVNGLVNVLKDYLYIQTALSGKASSRMAEVTGEEGYTIHRVLGYKPNEGFTYDKNNKIPADIIILDEISMVGGELFYSLIQSIKTGAKLIVLGDVHQLESIGCMNLAKDILESKTLKAVELTKIHRQAQKSGIITSSLAVRKKQPLLESRCDIGEKIYGELKDFKLNTYADKKFSMDKCIEEFKRCLPLAKDITEIQVLVPIKERGTANVFTLNNELQKIYNPNNNDNKITISISKDKQFNIKENDKIIIIRNNYKTVDEDGENTPIFNGQQGIVKKIDLESKIIYLRMPYVSDKLILIPKKNWGDLMLGYAMTVAKSQGSQYEYVIGCIDYSTPPIMLVKELVYTLITRASKYGVLLGETNALYKAMITSFVSTKQTFLKHMLDNETI
ncbi:AAA family ATPase [Clostridium botulinum]|uniref:AAA family ATPase n=1 Tax=Clostridium botulinum TaxID=1491 RepID=UPI00174A553C|nr:AAA family ATPase [Clostridium botulinum]MBD5589311.1 AAA family ATPase [Clostridium botulinum]